VNTLVPGADIMYIHVQYVLV